MSETKGELMYQLREALSRIAELEGRLQKIREIELEAEFGNISSYEMGRNDGIKACQFIAEGDNDGR